MQTARYAIYFKRDTENQASCTPVCGNTFDMSTTPDPCLANIYTYIQTSHISRHSPCCTARRHLPFAQAAKRSRTTGQVLGGLMFVRSVFLGPLTIMLQAVSPEPGSKYARNSWTWSSRVLKKGFQLKRSVGRSAKMTERLPVATSQQTTLAWPCTMTSIGPTPGWQDPAPEAVKTSTQEHSRPDRAKLSSATHQAGGHAMQQLQRHRLASSQKDADSPVLDRMRSDIVRATPGHSIPDLLIDQIALNVHGCRGHLPQRAASWVVRQSRWLLLGLKAMLTGANL